MITNLENAILSYEMGYENIYVMGAMNGKIENFLKNKQNPIIDKKNPNRNIKQMSKKYLKKVRYFLINHGLYYKFSSYKLNDDLRQWLGEQNPTSIYSVSLHIPLTIQIKKFLNIPIVLHIMDDWISTEIKSGALAFYWKAKLNKQFQTLILESKVHLAISDKMAMEYKNRYGVDWLVFHNPIKIDKWLPYQKKIYKTDCIFKIAFFGRKTSANSKILDSLSDIFTEINNETPLEFHIYSQIEGETKNVTFYHSFVAHDLLPELIPQFDLLVLPFIFENYWMRYAKLSMPTKLTEFMISGVPVYLLSPNDTAIYEFCKKNQCAFISDKLNEDEIRVNIQKIINDRIARERIANKAKEVAVERFDLNKVSNKFIELFS
jgi:glycosyltransferase involved in cell wall biosynthesis